MGSVYRPEFLALRNISVNFSPSDGCGRESEILTMLRSSLYILIISLIGINCQSGPFYCGNSSSYYGASGMIYSPFYPSAYRSNANCTYAWYVPSLSSVSLTIQYINLEPADNCVFDSVELSCRSHSVAVPYKYCGSGTYLTPVTFTPCTEVVILFKTDGGYNLDGYAISYRADPIACVDNCTLLTNSYGYICSCDPNGTNVTMPTRAPYPQCMGGCTRQSTSSSVFCNCLVSGSIGSTSTTSRCLPPCSPSYNNHGNAICDCTQSSTTTTHCPSECYSTTDSMGFPYCDCPQTTSSLLSCPYGCYIDSYYLGGHYCNCPTSTQPPISLPPTTTLSCSYGCYVEAGYWGNQYCNCPTSTQPPLSCSSGCVSDINDFGERYCRCPITTLPPCFSPCYYSWNYIYDYSGRRICYCRPTTTVPSPTESIADPQTIPVTNFPRGETDLPPSSKLGIGLGVGVGGFILLMLIVTIIILIVSNHRQVARLDQRHLENIAVVCRSMNALQAVHPGQTKAGFTNPMAPVAE